MKGSQKPGRPGKLPPTLIALLLASLAFIVSWQSSTAYAQGQESPESLSFDVDITLFASDSREPGRASLSIFLEKRGETWRASYTIISSNIDRRIVEAVLRGLFNYDVVGKGEPPRDPRTLIYVSLGEGLIYKCSIGDLEVARIRAEVNLGRTPLELTGIAIIAADGEDVPLLIEAKGEGPLGGYLVEARATLSSSTKPLCGEPVSAQIFNLLGGLSLILALMALVSVFWRHRVYREIESSYYF
ncbi:MAG: hypothetical protein LRS43_00870 [Desulfurococcales archaeon]|nr:hypothetical protein [Desulfurococcales archaeon]